MTAKDRIANLDAVRGVAVLGILAVNAMAFAWPFEAMMATQMLPMAVDGVLQGADRIGAWAIEALFMDKFRSLFCLLFGVSIFLIGGPPGDKEKRKLLLRRLGWLAVFGLIHGLAFWFGDILLCYAWAGLFVMLMRGLSGKLLVLVGGGITLCLMLLQSTLGLAMPYVGVEFASALEGHADVTTHQMLIDVATVRESFGAAVLVNLKNWVVVQSMSLTLMLPPTFALMVLGMGLFKLGFFHGRMSNTVYAVIFVVGMASLALKGWASWVEGGVSPEQLASHGLNTVGSALAIPIALAYATAIIKLPALFAWARPVGRMAFSAYLTQTLIMSSLFYMPWGPKLYGQMGPGELWALIGLIWAIQIFAAHLWLKAYQWGPLEWIWRSLTVGKRLPLSRSQA